MLGAANGRVRVIVFWSAACPVVQRGEPRLAALREMWPPEVEVFFVASNADEPRQMVTREASARGVAPVLIDEHADLADLLGATTTPQAFVADGDSRLRYRGAVDDSTMRRPEPTRLYLANAVRPCWLAVPRPGRDAGVRMRNRSSDRLGDSWPRRSPPLHVLHPKSISLVILVRSKMKNAGA